MVQQIEEIHEKLLTKKNYESKLGLKLASVSPVKIRTTAFFGVTSIGKSTRLLR